MDVPFTYYFLTGTAGKVRFTGIEAWSSVFRLIGIFWGTSGPQKIPGFNLL